MSRIIAISTIICLLLSLLIATPGVQAAGEPKSQAGAASPEAALDTALVQVDDQVLFRVRGTSSYPAEERAEAIAKRITDVAADRSFKTDTLSIDQSEEADVIMAGDRPLMYVTDADARLEHISRSYLAKVHLDRIHRTIDDYRHSRSKEVLFRSALYALGATVLLVVIVLLLIPLGRWLEKLVSLRVSRRMEAAEVGSLGILRAANIWKALHATLYGIRIGLIVVLLLLYLHLVLSLFPWTRGLAARLLGMDADALSKMGKAILSWIPDLIVLIVLYFLFRLVLKVLRQLFDAIGKKRVTVSGFDPDWALPTYKMARFAVLAFAVVVAYPYLPGSESAAFKGISVFIGLVFSLGSSAAVANVIAGYLIFYRRVFKVGDRVKVGDVVGDVLSIRLQVTHLLSLKNEEVTIPNSQILSGNVVNYTSQAGTQGLILHTEVGIGYEVPWRQVEAMLREAAERTPGLLKESPPFVLIKRLGDFSVFYELNIYSARPQESPETYHHLHRQILDVFNEHGIQIMTPAYVLDPAQPKVVARDQWYAAPASVANDLPLPPHAPRLSPSGHPAAAPKPPGDEGKNA